jgi:hypothetical protein
MLQHGRGGDAAESQGAAGHSMTVVPVDCVEVRAVPTHVLLVHFRHCTAAPSCLFILVLNGILSGGGCGVCTCSTPPSTQNESPHARDLLGHTEHNSVMGWGRGMVRGDLTALSYPL